MRNENAYLLMEWDSVCRSVLKGLRKIGHDITLTCHEEEQKDLKYKEENENSGEIKTGETISWETQVGKEKIVRTGMVVSVIPKGESAMKCVLKGTKKSRAKFSNISAIDRVLIVNVNESGNMHYLCPDIRKVKSNIRRKQNVY